MAHHKYCPGNYAIIPPELCCCDSLLEGDKLLRAKLDKARQERDEVGDMRIPYHKGAYRVDKLAFEKVVRDVEGGIPLNATMLGAIFGTPFWQLLILCQTNLKVDSNGDIQIKIYTKEENI